MANIREYSSSAALQGVRTTSQAADTAVQAGRRIGQLTAQQGEDRASVGQNIAKAVTGEGVDAIKIADEYYGRQETLKEGADWVQTFNGLTEQWNTMRNTADPNDPNVAERFRQDVLAPALETYGNGFISDRGRRAAENGRNRLMEHFGTATSADMVTLQGEAAVKNITTIANQAGLGIVKDPSAMEAVNAKIAETIKDFTDGHPNMTAEQMAKFDTMQEEIFRNNAKAAVHGIAESGPDGPAAAIKAIDSGRFSKFLTEGDNSQLTAYAQTQQRMAEEKTRSAEAEAQRKERDSQNADAGALTATVLDPTSGKVTVGPAYWEGVKGYIDKHPTAPPEFLRSLIAFGQKAITDEMTNKFTTDDPGTVAELTKRFDLPIDDPNFPQLHDLIKLSNEGKLSKQGFAEQRALLNDVTNDKVMKGALKRINDLAKGYDAAIAPTSAMGAILSPAAAIKLAQFKDDVRQMFREKYRDGTYREMSDPASPNYVGKIAMQPKYQTSNKDALQETIARITDRPPSYILDVKDDMAKWLRDNPTKPLTDYVPPALPVAPVERPKPTKSLSDFMSEGK